MRRPWMSGLRESLDTERSPKRGGTQTIVCALAATVIVIALPACDTWGPDKSVTSPSDDPTLTASISAPVTTVGPDTRLVGDLIPFHCSTDMQFTGPVDIAMTAAHDVDLNQVTLRLVHTPESGAGTFSAQAVNTFSQEDLASAFGSTQIPGGTVRSFRFRTELACGRQIPQSVEADIRFVEVSGRKNSITVTALFVSEVGVVVQARRRS